MSKFKVGDVVVRIGNHHAVHWTNFINSREASSGVYTVTHVSLPGGFIGVNGWSSLPGDDVPFSANNFELAPQAASVAVDWSFSEADRLQAVAHAAIDTYNEYIKSKPQKFYVEIIK